MLLNLRLLFLLVPIGLPGISLWAKAQRISRCRSTPGNAGFPTSFQWTALNTSISGKLAHVVPSAQFCKNQGGCSLQNLTSAVFRDTIPGAMDNINWEQDYDSVPPSLCFPETSVCSQGDVPLFGVLAETVDDIQAGVNFARIHNLRLAVKASGHDYLGRSTAKNSLLIWTHKLQSISFTDNFIVGGKNLGQAVTLGSGVPLQKMYLATLAEGKFAVGGTAATVVAAGGYVQGGGHSAISPTLGLAADNCLELNVVLANGSLVTANAVQNPDLFWAMRGGGAGSWGVIINATFRTYPTFNAAVSTMLITANTFDSMANVATIHARHIFDWDILHAGQYFYLTVNATAEVPELSTMSIVTFFPNATVEQADAVLQPFINDVLQVSNASILQIPTLFANINQALYMPDDVQSGINVVLGSRLVPAEMYKSSPETVGKVYSQLLNGGTIRFLGHLVAGGQVSANANVSNAINPAWRTAKTHMIIANTWDDTATTDEVHHIETLFQSSQSPILEMLAGKNSGAYSNEADALEPNFKTVFFGPNYGKLSDIKAVYDPDDLFIVRAGVGSERWDSDGFCQV